VSFAAFPQAKIRLPRKLRPWYSIKAGNDVLSVRKWFREITMSWTAPVVVEICLGMEVTSYASAVA